MKVSVTMILDIEDDNHPDYAARLLDNGLWKICTGTVGERIDNSLRSWSTADITLLSEEEN